MVIKDQYGKKLANQINAICKGNPYCTVDYRTQESERIRQLVFNERDKKIAALTLTEQNPGK